MNPVVAIGSTQLIGSVAWVVGRSVWEAWIKERVRTMTEEQKTPHDIGWAVKQMHNGARVRRAGWNGKGMFIVLMPELQLPPYNTADTMRKVNDRTAKWIGEDQPLNCRPYIAMYTAMKEWQPGWLPSQADLLAIDWELAE